MSASFEQITNKSLHHKLLLLCHLPLSSIIDDNIRAQPLFQLRVEEKFAPLPYFSTPPTYKKSLPPTSIFTIRSLFKSIIDR